MRGLLLLTVVYASVQALVLSEGEAIDSPCFRHPLSGTLEGTPCQGLRLDKRGKKQIASNKPFHFVVHCDPTGVDRLDFCTQANASLHAAGQIFSSVFEIERTITVNATIRPHYGNQEYLKEAVEHLGTGIPSKWLPLRDGDGSIRYYPQALYKQLKRGKNHKDASVDIHIDMNSLAADTYFQGDDINVTSKLHDFQGTILHELLHGLGFYSSYNYDSVEDRIYLSPILLKHKNGSTLMTGFFETRFDAFINVISSNNTAESLSMIKEVLWKEISPSNKPLALPDAVNSTNHLAVYDHIASVYPSTALVLESLRGKGTSPNSLGFLTSDNYIFALETSLNPFNPGSSISHLSHDEYAKTPDFFMLWSDVNGTVAHNIAKNSLTKSARKLSNATWLEEHVKPEMAIGPGTRLIMQTLGWKLRNETTTVYGTDEKAGIWQSVIKFCWGKV